MKNNIEKYALTEKQITACKEIKKAFANAKKAGIVFHAKSNVICAYKHTAFEKRVPLHKSNQFDYNNQIPCYDLDNCIIDSGADDTEYFPKGFIDEVEE